MSSNNAAGNGVTIGVDVGGTFTDLLLVDAAGHTRLAKVPTTPDNQAFGVLNAIDAADAELEQTELIVHGTTTTTNAVLERKLARTGLITTAGFRDVLELGRRTRPTPYGMTGSFIPLIDRRLRREVAERMDADGNVVTPLDESQLRRELSLLLEAGCEAVVIHFLHAYRNPVHEQRAASIARELWPNSYVTAGHEILSEYREYERGVTAAVNASVRPVLDRYIERLAHELATRGYRRDLLVMRGNGGTESSRTVADTAVSTVMSGPASGVMAAAWCARDAGVEHVITYDMGGTSTDVGLIRDGVPQVSSELELEYAMPIHVPMVDVHTIGAGGGSIARVDAGGLLRVGPQSAGASPGPVCYGRGGQQITITDANLVLGRLNPAALLSVDNPVGYDDVCDLMEQQIGRPLGLDAHAAAAAVLHIANDAMAGALRMVTLSRGHDPRDYALFAFGGAGPLHAAALAAELGVPQVLVPARPGLINALGCVVADLRHDFVRTVNTPLDHADMAAVHQVLEDATQLGRQRIAQEEVEISAVKVRYSADMQFQGQSHLLSVQLPDAQPTREFLQQHFERVYWERFAVELPEIRCNLVNLHITVLGERTAAQAVELLEPVDTDSASSSREVWFGGRSHDTRIFERQALAVGDVINGPAIVEQLDTTVVIPPDASADVDGNGNLLINVQTTQPAGAAT